MTGKKSLAPFNPSAALDKLEILSALLAAEAATGTAQLSNGALKLTGTKTGLNVFAVDGGALAQAFSVQVSVPTGASVLINVTGSRVAIENKGFTITGATAAAMLWNLPGASFLKISSVGLTGSVLAPRARVTFDSGSINGSLVARAFTSSGSAIR